MAALHYQAVEFHAQRGQVGQLAVDVSEVVPRNKVNGGARYVVLISEAEERLNLIERETE